MLLPWVLATLALGDLQARRPMDAPIPPQPPPDLSVAPRQAHEAGTGSTLFVNFDGISLTECSPSNSKRDCHWYNFDRPIEPFSGTMQTKVAVLQAMRRDANELGLRITGVRPPPDEDYTMVVYGGTEEDYGALGSAPSGDCLDTLPNQIAFAHVDGELNTWVNGGATTALHEAAHSWGLDHIDVKGSIMFPSGDNSPTAFREACDQIVADTDLTPVEGKCADLNREFCGEPGLQNATAILSYLFGPPYVDSQAPTVTLAEPMDGAYFQGPADFQVRFDVEDDLHPQAYSMWAWIDEQPRPERPSKLVTPGFNVTDLPVGSYEFHVVLADEAGNETRLDFEVEVGEDPPPVPELQDEGCACSVSSESGNRADGWNPAWLGLVLAGLCLRPRQR